MKNKFTARLAALMCLVLLISTFAACSVKNGKNGDETSSLVNPGGDSWIADGNGIYEPVTITNVELVQLVNDALGSEAAGWDGNLGSLTDEQLQKVEQAAQDKGLIIEKDDTGNTVIKKEEIPTTQATPEEVTKLMNQVSVQDLSNVSPSQYVELSKVAAENNMAVVTKPGTSEVEIVRPVVTRVQTPATQTPPVPQQSQTPQQSQAQTRPVHTAVPLPNTTSIYIPPTNKPVPTPAPTKTPVPTFSTAWVNTVSNNKNDVLYSSEVLKNGGVVAVGITFLNGGSNAAANIVAYNEKNKELWSKTISGDNAVTFEDVTVLNDGSIIAVGYCRAENIEGVTDADYKCKGTIEGFVVKFSDKGDIIWKKFYGGSAGDMLYAVSATPDGGFVMGGKTESKDADLKDIGTLKIKAFLIKCDANGNIQWRQGFSSAKHAAVEDLTTNNAGDVYATIAFTMKDGEFSDVEGPDGAKKRTLVTKLDSAGNVKWKKCFWDSGITNLYAIETATDGGCVVAGYYSANSNGTNGSFKDFYNAGNPGTFDGMIVKLNSDGSSGWMTPLIGFESDYITGITKVNGGFAVSGYTSSSNRDFPVSNKGDYDVFVYTVNDYGTKKNVYSLGGSAADNSLGICSDGGKSVYFCGLTNSADGYYAECDAKGNENMAVGYVARFELS